jgi:hypothetical protein
MMTPVSVHSAVFLSTLQDNPDHKEDAMMVSLGIINTRSRLAAPYNERNCYPGHCISASAIAVPVAQVDLTSAETQLLTTAAMVKREYARQQAYPALLGAMAQFTDIMLGAFMANP